MDIEIVETSNKSEELRKAYIKKQIEITDVQDKLKSIFIRQNKDAYLDNMEIVNELINATIERTFHEGQSFGKETIVYREKDSVNNWDSKKVYPKAGTRAYQGD